MVEDQPGERSFRKISGFINSSGSSKLYRIALEESRRNLSAQLNELNGIRSKTVSFVTLVCTATAFLVSTTISNIEPNIYFYYLAFIATLLMLWALFRTKKLLSPATGFSFKLEPFVLVDIFIEDRSNPPSESELLRSLTENYENRIDFNQNQIEWIRKSYGQVVTYGLASLFIWAITMWSFGTVGS